MTFQAYFFDFDHTLFDSDASESLAFAHAMADNAVEPSPALFATYKTINTALWNEVESAGRPPAEVKTLRFQRLVDAAGLDTDPLDLAASFTFGMQEFGELYPGALEILEELSSRAPIVMVTNAISVIQRRRIQRLGIEQLFDAIVISSEIGVSKPLPGIFDAAFAEVAATGRHPDRAATLMIGDSLTSDIAGGVAAGLVTCWFNPTGKTANPQLSVDHEITSLHQLLEL